jgi:hypothetical protein
MSTGQVLTLLLSSSLLSAGLTSLITLLVSKANYKREYYKKLLDRRLNAYEEVELVINSLSTFIRTDKGELCPFVCAGGEQRRIEFLGMILRTSSHSLWLSSEVSGLLTELNVFMLNEIDNHISQNGDYNTQLEQLGAKNAATFRRLREELQDAMYSDLRNMSDIPKFIRGIRGHGDFPVFPKQ